MASSDLSGGPGVQLQELATRLGVKVKGGLLETALTHASFANERPKACPGGSNERLEFLGDAILQFVTAQHLVRRFPGADAGELTRLRAAVVSEEALSAAAGDLGLGDFLRLGRGEEASGGRRRRSLLADCFEAVVGAVYLSSGMREAARFSLGTLGPRLEEAARGPRLDPKTALQEAAQAAGRSVRYRVTAEAGPDHGKLFRVEVLVDGTTAGQGSGLSKKAAEREAAAEALGRWPRT